jgi:uncharacterized protein (DUF2147 family)
MTAELTTNDIEIRDTFVIPEENWTEFQERFAKLQRKGQKLGQPISFDVLSKELVQVDENTSEYRYTVKVTGQEPVINGWQMIAVIQHEGHLNIFRRFPGAQDETVAIPEQYRTAQPVCEHCNTTRDRNDTFLVMEEATGQFRQVGRNCLRDFIGHGDPLALARFFEEVSSTLGLAEEADEGRDYGRREKQYMYLSGFLAHVQCMIEAHGWVSRSRASDYETATADAALSNMYCQANRIKNRDGSPAWQDPDDAHYTRAEAAVIWFRQWASENSRRVLENEYLHNLSVAVGEEGEMFSARNTGLVASLMSLYARELEQEIVRKRERAIRQHVGTVGKRETFELTVSGFTYIEGDFGTTTLVSFIEGNGNRVKWFASNCPDLQDGETYTVKATVKAHDEYKGVPQTVITRAKVL